MVYSDHWRRVCVLYGGCAGCVRALDNVFVERLWRTVKYEHVYLHEYAQVPELEKGLHEYFAFYNHERLHQSLSYQTPVEVHLAGHCGPAGS